MTNPQGTEWESEIVERAEPYELGGDRYPKRGQKGEPDLWLVSPFMLAARIIPAVVWKRLVGKKGDGPRKPNGERRVAIVCLDDLLWLLNKASETEDLAVLVQAKWTQNLNVTKTLGDLVQWTKERMK